MAGFGGITKIPELRKRILFTLGMLAVYRIMVFVTVPGVNRSVMKQIMAQSSGTFLGMFNMFSGGALEQLSIIALGIMPYISASIILQLLTVVVPTLERLSKEGDAGRKKINQYTRYGTIMLSVVQGYFIAAWLEGSNATYRTFGEVVLEPGWSFRLMTILTLTTGTAFVMWLGEQITERGIGNGISLIIFAGIVADMPDGLVQLYQKAKLGDIGPFNLALIAAIVVGVVAVIIFFERAQRRIPVQYAKRVIGRKQYGGQTSHLPLKVNTAGVIPPIFASSILMFPAQLAHFINTNWMRAIQDALQPNDWRYQLLYVLLIVFFCYFYTAVTFNPVDVADNLKKNGGFIPGIRPGKKTAEYIDKVLTRITFGGAIYVSAVCVLPTIMIAQFKVPFYFGGTGLLIVVGVALDTVQQIQSHLISRHYDGFLGQKGPKIRGRRSR
ncbi:MAG: preprotein translocase subunit SecY [Proteobacteria bacterium]|nr:MAG: preprotein translocase subunit SecY [Pseudomonadota bacterium]PIE17844.1 MAG: preprotein translocase subunit SecY [Pseudomonadota bacterium]